MNGLDFVFCILYGSWAALGFMVVGFLGWAVAKLLDWIDDYENVRQCNVFTAWILRRFGYTHENGRYRHPDGDSSDGSVVYGAGFLLSFVGPPLGYVSYHQPAIPLAAATLVGLALIARFANRLKKKFDLHVATRDAHK